MEEERIERGATICKPYRYHHQSGAKTTKEYKVPKGLKKKIFDNIMTNTELILNMLAEVIYQGYISRQPTPKDFEESKKQPNKVVMLPR